MKKHRWIEGLAGILVVAALSGCNEPSNHVANHIANLGSYTLNAIGGDLPPGSQRPSRGPADTTHVMQSSIHIDEITHTVQMNLSESPHTSVPPTQNSVTPHPPTLSAPLGWRVYVTLSDPTPEHSIMVVPYDNGLDPEQMNKHVLGKGATGTHQSFLFKARTPGEYAIVCAVPGHPNPVLGLIQVVSDRDKPLMTT